MPDGSGSRAAVGRRVRWKQSCTALRIADDAVAARRSSPARRSIAPISRRASSLLRFSMMLFNTIADCATAVSITSLRRRSVSEGATISITPIERPSATIGCSDTA